MIETVELVLSLNKMKDGSTVIIVPGCRTFPLKVKNGRKDHNLICKWIDKEVLGNFGYLKSHFDKTSIVNEIVSNLNDKDNTLIIFDYAFDRRHKKFVPIVLK